MPELLTRRRQDLEAQLASLPNELDHWKELSKERAYEKHHSQIAALSRQMRDLNDKVTKAWDKSNDFVAMQKAQRDCAAVHGVWNYFREKLLMRSDARLGGYLRAADAYVWACYAPVLDDRRARHQSEAFREPPLVTFDAEQSPWARKRHGGAEGGEPAEAPSSLLEQTLAKMPIAILGMPWYSVELLPQMSALAHETGHVIEADFRLQTAVENSVTAATEKSRLQEGWSSRWRKEVFADLFACYGAGPAFVWTLADLIPESPEQVKTKQRPSRDAADNPQWGKYPPATLRMLLNLHALRVLGYGDDATKIEAYWKDDYTEHAMAAFEKDVELVVPAVYEAANLPAALAFSQLKGQCRQIEKITVTQDSDLAMTERYDPRALVAIASKTDRIAMDDALRKRVWQRLQQHMVSARPPGLLSEQQTRAESKVPLHTDDIAGILFTDDAGDDL